MGQSTNEVRRDIEQTRAEMTETLDAIAEKTSPARIVRRQRRRVGNWMQSLRENVMGIGDAGAGALGSVQQGAANVGGGVRDTPQQLRQQAQGHPLVAGLVAFGSGVLVAAVIPSTRTERQVVGRVREEAEPVVQELKEAGQQVADRVKESAQQAAGEVRDAAQHSAQAVSEEAKTSAQEVKEVARSSAQDVAEHAKAAVDEARNKGDEFSDYPADPTPPPLPPASPRP